MRKFVRTYSPFLVYFVCVALAYFLCFYLFPKYNAALAYLGFLIIYTYIDIGVFILGFFMGKIIVKRSIDISFLLCLIYALISFGLMLLIGSLKYVFYDYMYSNFTFTFSIFIESLGDRDSLFVSIGTFISFFIGEIIEYINDKSNSWRIELDNWNAFMHKVKIKKRAKDYTTMTFTRFLYFQIFMSDKIDMVISVALPPVASLSAPMLVAKKYVLSTVSI